MAYPDKEVAGEFRLPTPIRLDPPLTARSRAPLPWLLVATAAVAAITASSAPARTAQTARLHLSYRAARPGNAGGGSTSRGAPAAPWPLQQAKLAPGSGSGYDNASIADVGLRFVGQWGGNACAEAQRSGATGSRKVYPSYPAGSNAGSPPQPGRRINPANGGDGQCRSFTNCVVWIASGGPVGDPRAQWIGGAPGGSYFGAFLRPTNGAPGGAEIADASKLMKGDIVQQGQSANAPNLHTYIVVRRLGGREFDVVDSNYGLDEYVREHSISIALSKSVRAFRMGSLAAGPASEAARETTAFDRYIKQRFPRERGRGYRVCPSEQLLDGTGSCMARFVISNKQHLLSAETRFSATGAVSLAKVSDLPWTRRWSPYSRAIPRSIRARGSAAVNTPAGALDWAWLVINAQYFWEQKTQRFNLLACDGPRCRGFEAIYRTRCTTRGGLITCVNRFGDAIRYRPQR